MLAVRNERWLRATNAICRQRFLFTRKSSQLHCANRLKQGDYEGYVCSLLIQNPVTRRFVIALRTLNLELSLVRDQAKSNATAELRFAFWRQCIDRSFERDHSVLGTSESVGRELNQCLRQINFKFSRRWIDRLIESRERNLSTSPFDTMDELELYCEQSVVPVYISSVEYHAKLTKDADLSKQQLNLDHAASHLGRAHGVVNVLRGIGHHALHDRCYIPSQLLLECGYSVEQLLRDCRDVLGGRSTSLPINVREVTFRLASVASLHLQKADSILTNNQLTSKRTAQIFLPVHVLQRYLKQLQRIDFDVLHSTLRTRDGLLPMYLWWKTSRWSDG